MTQNWANLVEMRSAVKRYLANCNLHGTRYIVESDLHWTERVFWLIVCISCWCGCAAMIKSSLDAFLYRSVAFTVESTYLDWQTEFPSVSVCMRSISKSLETANSLYDKKFNSPIKPSSLWRWLFSGSLQKPPKRAAEAFAKLTSDDVVNLYENSIANCTELMSKCFWKSIEFNCCEVFKPLKTAAGKCYTFNSKQTDTENRQMNDYTMNQNTGIGYLHVGFTSAVLSETYVRIQVFVHNNLEIPTTVTYADREIYLRSGKVVSVYVSLKETFNEPALKSVPAGRRGCRLSDEIENLHIYKRYSNDGCVIAIQMENMMRICGCVSHLFPRHFGMPVCNYTGLQCLQRERTAAMGKKESQDRCLPDCEGALMRIYQNKYLNGDASLFEITQGLHLELLELPTTRFKRYVVRSLLDLAGNEVNIGVPGSVRKMTTNGANICIGNSPNILGSEETELLTFEDVQNVVAQAEGPGTKLVSYTIQKYSAEKLGFLASHKQLKVKIQKAGSSTEESKAYFVKAVPHEVPTQAEFVCETKIFLKEVLFFNYIVPELNKFYPGERWSPKCYLAHNEVIVLEELQASGFSMREKLFDEESINAALSALARMHAASLGAEARLGKPLIELFPEAFEETGVQDYGKQLMWYKAGVKVAVAVAEQMGLDPSQIPEACQEVFEANKPSRSLQNVVSHSDPWSNNFMFREGKPPLCYVVDFQLVRYSPPGYDIAMLLYLTASQKLRETRGEAMVRHYYATLCETLQMYDPPVEPPSFSSILKGMENQKLGALVTAMIYLPTVLMDGALGAKVMENPVTFAKYRYSDRRDVVLSNMKRDVVYDTRIKEVVGELHEFSQRLHNLPVPC